MLLSWPRIELWFSWRTDVRGVRDNNIHECAPFSHFLFCIVTDEDNRMVVETLAIIIQFWLVKSGNRSNMQKFIWQWAMSSYTYVLYANTSERVSREGLRWYMRSPMSALYKEIWVNLTLTLILLICWCDWSQVSHSGRGKSYCKPCDYRTSIMKQLKICNCLRLWPLTFHTHTHSFTGKVISEEFQ